MFADLTPGWAISQSAITAGAGLLGVLVGGLLTARNQKLERLNAHYRRQLQEFYSPMVAIKQEIDAKNESSKIVGETLKKIRAENASRRSPETDEVVRHFSYDYEQWVNEIFPLLQKMRTYFSEHLWLAEQSTRDHYYKLIHYIEVEQRRQSSTLSTDLAIELTFDTDQPQELYDDLERNFWELRDLVKDT